MRHAVLRASDWHRATEVLAGADSVACLDGAPAIVCAAISPQMRPGVAVWLPVTSHVSAPIVARDVKTMSFLCDLSSVILYSDDGLSRQHAEIVHALVSEDDVSMSNDSATLTHAFNRPRPRTAITIWYTEGRPDEASVTLRRCGDDADVVSLRI